MTIEQSHFMFFMYISCISCLTVATEDGAILPLGPLDADPDRQRSGALDAVVSGFYHCYGFPTPDILTCPVEGLLTLVVKATEWLLQRGLPLCSQQAIDLDNYR